MESYTPAMCEEKGQDATRTPVHRVSNSPSIMYYPVPPDATTRVRTPYTTARVDDIQLEQTDMESDNPDFRYLMALFIW
jgi:hypothetical protein